jgi:hypothetical protein
VAGFGTGLTCYTIDQTFPSGTGYEDIVEYTPCYKNQSLVLGWGINEQFLAIWSTHVTHLSGRAGVGLRYYMRPTAPSVAFSGGYSLGTRWELPLERDNKERSEAGWWIGAAHEFSPHLSFEVSYSLAHPDVTHDGIELDSRVSTVGLLITYLGY